MAELPSIVLGGRTENRLARTPGLSIHRAGEVSARKGEVPDAGGVHACGYERIRDCTARYRGADCGKRRKTAPQIARIALARSLEVEIRFQYRWDVVTIPRPS